MERAATVVERKPLRRKIAVPAVGKISLHSKDLPKRLERTERPMDIGFSNRLRSLPDFSDEGWQGNARHSEG